MKNRQPKRARLWGAFNNWITTKYDDPDLIGIDEGLADHAKTIRAALSYAPEVATVAGVSIFTIAEFDRLRTAAIHYHKISGGAEPLNEVVWISRAFPNGLKISAPEKDKT